MKDKEMREKCSVQGLHNDQVQKYDIYWINQEGNIYTQIFTRTQEI